MDIYDCFMNHQTSFCCCSITITTKGIKKLFWTYIEVVIEEFTIGIYSGQPLIVGD
jgi:hypothetical protein